MPACPVDQSAMRAIPLQGGWAEHQCDHCDGLWLPGVLVRTTIGEVPRQRLEATGSARRMRCPNDEGALIAIVHHGVEIDVCPRCSGVWLDAGERARIPDASRSTTVREATSSDMGGALDLLDLATELIDDAGDAAGKLLEFIGDAFSSL